MAGTTKSGAVAAKPVPVHLEHCRIAGLAHYEWNDVSPWLRPGQSLELIAETDNPHDPYAVEVYWRDEENHLPMSPDSVPEDGPEIAKLGYLPRYANHVVSHLLRQSKPLRCTLKAIHSEERLDRMLEIKVELVG